MVKLVEPDLRDQPVRLGVNGRLRRETGSILDLGGDLILGDVRKHGRKRKKKGKTARRGPQAIGPPAFSPAVLQLHRAARFETTGWVHMNPGTAVVVGRGATLKIGGATYFSGGTILCSESIDIGERCAIAWGVTIMDCDMHQIVADGEVLPHVAPVRIGDHVWIGAGARILKGVTVGDGAIVAGGAVVTKDVEPRTMVAGIPAAPVRKNVDWS